jgi:hypothetical protein
MGAAAAGFAGAVGGTGAADATLRIPQSAAPAQVHFVVPFILCPSFICLPAGW